MCYFESMKNGLVPILLISMLLSLACQRSEENAEVGGNSKVPTDTLAQPAKDSVDSPESLPEPAKEVLVNKSSFGLLPVGEMHENEFPSDFDSMEWVGLYHSENRYVLRIVYPDVSRVFDAVLDSDNEKTGWGIKVRNQDECLILIRGLLLRERFLEPVWEKNFDYLIPGDTLHAEYQGLTYRLFATGNHRPDEIEPEWYRWTDYKLFMERKSASGWDRDTIVQIPRFDEAMVRLLFAGDIDGDGGLDLLLDKTYHYNLFNPALYLSGKRESGKLLKLVAEHRSLGC